MKAKQSSVWRVWWLLAAGCCIVASRNDIKLEYSEVVKPRGSGNVEETAFLVWGYDRENQEILIEVQVRKASWIGLGLNSDGSMNGSDFAIGGWDEENQPFFYDAHVVGEWPPVKDESQDYELVALTNNETHSFLRVWRKFFTCDPFDLEIENDTVRVTIVYGEDQDLQYSEDHFFYRPTFFLEVDSFVKQPSTLFSYDFRMNDFLIPEQDTTYACTFIPLPQVTTKHHIIMYEPVIDPASVGIVHHILIYACANSTIVTSEVGDCYGGDSRFSQCMTSMFGWAVGGEAFYFPNNTGVPIGTEKDPQYIRIEVHYSNFGLKSGIKDNSGIRILYTPELREHDSAILMVGVFTFPAQFIPPGVENFRNYGLCNTELIPQVMDEPFEDLTVTTFLLHAHLTARGLRVMHYRNGSLIGSLGEDKNYDFNLQQIRNFPGTATIKLIQEPYVYPMHVQSPHCITLYHFCWEAVPPIYHALKKGDQILVECTGNTMDREEVTFGGPSTLNEMCIGFLFYYPAIPIAACWSLMDVQGIAETLGQGPTDTLMDGILSIDSIEWDDEMREAAQKAVIEANHIVVVQNRKGDRVNQTSQSPPVFPPVPHPCEDPPSP